MRGRWKHGGTEDTESGWERAGVKDSDQPEFATGDRVIIENQD
jgi:hypothetical protein